MRKFIAGAVCPQCKGLDKIYITVEAGEDVARCTVCDYRSVRPKDDDPVQAPEDHDEALQDVVVGTVKIILRH